MGGWGGGGGQGRREGGGGRGWSGKDLSCVAGSVRTVSSVAAVVDGVVVVAVLTVALYSSHLTPQATGRWLRPARNHTSFHPLQPPPPPHLPCLLVSHSSLSSYLSFSVSHSSLSSYLSHFSVFLPLTINCLLTSHSSLSPYLSHFLVFLPLRLPCLLTSHSSLSSYLSHFLVFLPLTVPCLLTSHSSLSSDR